MTRDNKQRPMGGEILVVEDDKTNLLFLQEFLSEHGYQVRPASNGKLALRSVQDKPPELILLDYKMPEMNGIEVCHKLKADPTTQDIPVLFLSGLGESDLKVQALEAGGIDYITKPINPSELLVRIENHLKMYRLQQSLALQSVKLQQEIEERKLTEEKLLQSLEREQILADIVRDAPLAIAYTYPDGRLENCNKEFSTLTGYSHEELNHIDWNQTLTPVKWRDSEAAKLKQLSSLKKNVRYEKEFIRKDGEPTPIELVVTAKYDTGQNLLHYITFITDISNQKKMEQQLLLNEKMVTIAGLAAGVAHEINTPLSAILQAHQLVEMGISPQNTQSQEKARESNLDLMAVQDYFKKTELDFFMGAIRESALRASHIITNLLEFSRPNEGNFSTAKMKDIMESSLLLSMADYNLKKKYGINSIHFVKEYEPHLPTLICVAQEIEQVLLSLIQNSVQSLAEIDRSDEKCITLRLHTTKTKAIFEVADNGPGISEDHQQHIFDPFFTTRDVGSGTGLGLSVSHAIIVEKHKGEIKVQSKPGQGATFTIVLPLSPEL